MKRILIIIAAITILTMTACSSEKNTTKRKLYKLPTITDETVPIDTQDVIDTEYDYSNETEQIDSIDTFSDTIATTSEPVITEAVTDTAAPNNSMESTPSEITTTQKIPNKPVVSSPPLLAPVSDITTAANAEASVPVPQISVEDVMEICIRIAKDMGYTRNTAFTSENAAWWNPVTISLKDSKQSIERTLSEYIRFHTLDNLAAYGYDTITCFNIYAEKLKEGAYRIYFLFA